MPKLRDQLVLVTGAARGLGSEICRQLAEQGARVVGADVRQDQMGAAIEEWPGDLQQHFAPLLLDLTDEIAVISAVQRVVKEYGRIDALVNNAGIRMVNPVWKMSTRDWDQVHAVNLKAQFILSREVLKQSMLDQGEGQLVFISSLAGVRGVPGGAAYSSSKWGIRGLAASIAQDLKQKGIGVSCLLPGMLLTPMARESEVWHLGLDWMDPAACARLVLFCLEQDADTVLPEIIVHNRAQI